MIHRMMADFFCEPRAGQQDVNQDRTGSGHDPGCQDFLPNDRGIPAFVGCM
jgi:hypothetical protein